MKAEWMAVLAIALMFSSCAGMEKPEMHKVGENAFFVEVEEFDLTSAEVQELEGASGGKVVVLQDESGKAEATIKLSKGNYEVTVYALGPSFDEDAFFVTVGNSEQQRRFPESPGEILPTGEVVAFTQEADGPCSIVLQFAESNVQLDRIEFKHIP